ncbi:MAG: DUF1573 domain-containing protein [Verrucomicrobia bacterium]|nr:DUF1573 domain-containing protein [Verrucomicrobiota bacterium]
MNTNHLLLQTAALFLGGCSVAFGQLRWETRQLDLHPGLEEKKVVARFAFTNAGNDTVGIDAVETSCGCMTAGLEKRLYRSGEKGEITATFMVGQRTGLQQKTITVHTDEHAQPVTTLLLRVFLPEVLKIEPVLVSWETGEALSPKTIMVRVTHESPVHILEATSESPTFVSQLKMVQPGKEYRIMITPSDTRESAFTMIRIKTDLPERAERHFCVYARIESH